MASAGHPVGSKFDIAVLGGGPAGAALAILMAKRGARAALIEKSGFATFRPGEHLPPAVTGALKVLDCSPDLFAGAVIESPGILSDWGAALPLYKSYIGGRDGLGLNLARVAFDRALFEQAGRCGAALFDRSNLVAAARDKGHWILGLKTPGGLLHLQAGLVADATGRTAAFARRQGVTWQSHGDLTAVCTVLPHHHGMAADDRLLVAACATGWWSATPTPSGAIVATFYGRASQRRREGLNPAAWWAQGVANSEIIAARFGGCAVTPVSHVVFPAFPRLMCPMHGPGWFAVGDAATCHDPLSGHGILYAFESAFRAAEMAALVSPLDRIGRVYEEAMRARFMRHVALRRDAYAEAAHRFPEAPFWREW